MSPGLQSSELIAVIVSPEAMKVSLNPGLISLNVSPKVACIASPAICKCEPLQLNALQTESEKKEQTGFSNYLIGIFGMYRNVTAHEPKRIYRPIDKREALDVLTMISFAHGRIDNAILVPK